MTDNAEQNIHRVLMRIERDQAHESLATVRRRLEAIGEDLSTKGGVLTDCDTTDLLFFALDLEKIAVELRVCSEELNRATAMVSDQIVYQARMRGYEI